MRKNRKPIHPFEGQTMKCVLCGRTKKSHPRVESNWTHITLPAGTVAGVNETKSGYFCDKCHSKCKTSEDFSQLYERAIKKIAGI